ncbi:hypothetical protein FHX37_0646 [Haloactinospora alba]|uniref:Uncharacterized protein n=2 Tax=Haloactinospora alba TaxID=405555 RepID=A0A543NFY5_9ACTN|nr:hypothetical protein FHX37_0646 [Haloactinospora alba]
MKTKITIKKKMKRIMFYIFLVLALVLIVLEASHHIRIGDLEIANESFYSWPGNKKQAEEIIHKAKKKGYEIERMEAVYSGFLIVTDNGVALFNAKNKMEQWSYTFPESPVAVETTPLDRESNGEQYIVISFDTEGLLGTRSRTVALDAEHGEVYSDNSSYGSDESPEKRIKLTTSTSIISTPSDNHIESYSLESSEKTWEFHTPDGCDGKFTKKEHPERKVATTEESVIVEYACKDTDTTSIVSLDSEDGSKKWEDSWKGNDLPSLWTMEGFSIPSIDPWNAETAIARNELGERYTAITKTGSDFSIGPWKKTPSLDDYIKKPLENPETTPENVVIGFGGKMTDATTAAIAHELLRKDIIDIDDLAKNDLTIKREGEDWFPETNAGLNATGKGPWTGAHTGIINNEIIDDKIRKK